MPDTLQPSILDLPYLILDEPPAHHVATQFSQRIWRVRLALRRAQGVEPFGGLLQLGIESPDAEPSQRCFHSVDNPVLLSDQVLAFAVGPLGIFVFDCWDRHHLAVITLPAQPAEKGAFEQIGVERSWRADVRATPRCLMRE